MVAVEVLRTGQRVLKQDQDRQEHLGGHFGVDAFELLEIDPALLAEDFVEQVLDFSLVLQTVEEHLAETKSSTGGGVNRVSYWTEKLRFYLTCHHPSE